MSFRCVPPLDCFGFVILCYVFIRENKSRFADAKIVMVTLFLDSNIMATNKVFHMFHLTVRKILQDNVLIDAKNNRVVRKTRMFEILCSPVFFKFLRVLID